MLARGSRRGAMKVILLHIEADTEFEATDGLEAIPGRKNGPSKRPFRGRVSRNGLVRALKGHRWPVDGWLAAAYLPSGTCWESVHRQAISNPALTGKLKHHRSTVVYPHVYGGCPYGARGGYYEGLARP